MKRMNIVIVLAAVLVFCGPALSRAQSEAEKQPVEGKAKAESSNSKTKPDSKTKQVLKLTDVTRVSTADAARGAAQDMARKRSGGAQDKAAGPDVVEFQPVDRSPLATTETVTASSKKSKKSPFKSVHGSLYGSADSNRPGNHETAGEAGATSKSGKSSVYVQTDRSSAAPPSSH